MVGIRKNCLILAVIASAVGACSDSTTATSAGNAVEFVPGRYRAEIIEIDSDCEPRLEDILAATKQPRAGIVHLEHENSGESGELFAWFRLVEPRVGGGFDLPTTVRCDEFNDQDSSCSLLPGRIPVDSSMVLWGIACYSQVVLVPPKLTIYQGESRGVFEAEVIHQWNDLGAYGCLPMETIPRNACTERFVIRYTLVRECPLNCNALGSGWNESRMDIFPDLDGTYLNMTLPEELYECVPIQTPSPMVGGECPEEFIVRR